MTTPFKHTCYRPRQGGFALGYLILFVALFALISVSVIQANKRDNRLPGIATMADKIVLQGEYIRGQLVTCALLYPNGNNGTGFHLAYPAGSAVAVSVLECPGSLSSNKNLWTGADGNFVPAPLTGFAGWTYTNDVNGIKLVLTSTGGADQNLAEVRAAAKYGTVEAVQSGNDYTLWVLKG